MKNFLILGLGMISVVLGADYPYFIANQQYYYRSQINPDSAHFMKVQMSIDTIANNGPSGNYVYEKYKVFTLLDSVPVTKVDSLAKWDFFFVDAAMICKFADFADPSSDTLALLPADSQVVGREWNIDSLSVGKIVGFDSVSTSFGAFSNCLKVEYRVSNVLIRTNWFDQAVGLVQRLEGNLLFELTEIKPILTPL